MPIKSLISELPKIVSDGNREAAAILDRLSSANRITLQTNEVVLPAKASSNIRFGTQAALPAADMNRLIYGDNLLAMQALLAGDPQTGLPSLRGKVDLIYIDPPFDSKADYRTKLTLPGGDINQKPTTRRGGCSSRDSLCRICNPTHFVIRICNPFCCQNIFFRYYLAVEFYYQTG